MGRTVVAFTDIVSIFTVMGVMLLLDMLSYMLDWGLLAIAGGMLGVFTLGWIFTNQGIIYMSAYDQASATFKTQTVDPNLIAATMAVLTIVSFIFLFRIREGVK